ncbi:NDR1/HIN1-like protein 3 [Argentina anserina]|uniref:NDR1/HIN1-like protein 3 n=1 Tax=Argentina anserina TaxID=57926 RepID=UPI00217635C0|nr:NDR1/HIN1-like protein 3 [Potentilla anserina]
MTKRGACIDCSFFIFCNTILCFTLVFFIVWSIFLPQEPQFHITNASLTQFDFTNTNINNTLHYNLELNITIRNQNKVDISTTIKQAGEEDTAAGSYSIDVQLALQLNVRYEIFQTRYYQQSRNKINCKLKVPLSTKEKSSICFKSTKCRNVNIMSDHVV